MLSWSPALHCNGCAGSRLGSGCCLCSQPHRTHDASNTFWLVVVPIQTEFYLLEYAACLAMSRQTWQLAAEYLAWCPVHGEAALKQLLEELPVGQSDRLAQQALQARRLSPVP